MTPEELQVHKEKIRKVMMDHLNDLGYPNMTSDQIMAELKDMWVKIKDAGLVLEGMSFAAFADMAESQYFLAKMAEIMDI